MLRTANLALKFGLELAAFAAFAYWGAQTGTGAGAIVLAIAAPGLMIAVWGAFAAPKSSRRLGRGARVPLELSVFALAAVALLAAGSTVAAGAFAVLAVINAVLLAAFGQLDE
jgi:hypothetical protein